MPLGHALLAVNSAQTGAITRFKWRFWLKVGVFSSGDRVEVNNEAKLDERNGRAKFVSQRTVSRFRLSVSHTLAFVLLCSRRALLQRIRSGGSGVR